MVIQMAQLAVFIYVSPQLRQDRRSLTPLRSHVCSAAGGGNPSRERRGDSRRRPSVSGRRPL